MANIPVKHVGNVVVSQGHVSGFKAADECIEGVGSKEICDHFIEALNLNPHAMKTASAAPTHSLIHALEKGDRDVQRVAVWLIFKMKIRPPKRLKEKLIGVFSDKDGYPKIRIAAARILEVMGSGEYLKQIADQIFWEIAIRHAGWNEDPLSNDEAESVALLGRIGLEFFKKRLSYRDKQDQLFNALLPEFGSELIEMLKSENEKSAELLSLLFWTAELFNTEQVEKLLEVAKWCFGDRYIPDSNTYYYRLQNAISSCLRRQEKFAVPILVRELNSVNENVETDYAVFLINCLDRMGSMSMLPMKRLGALLRSSNNDVKEVAQRALFKPDFSQQMFNDLVIAFLGDIDVLARFAIIETIWVNYSNDISGIYFLPILETVLMGENCDPGIKSKAEELKTKIEEAQL